MNPIAPWFETDLRRLDALLSKDAAGRAAAPEPVSRPEKTVIGGENPWENFVKRLELDPFERDLLLLALAPDLDPRYGALYLCLYGANRPSAEIALRLLNPADAWSARALVAPTARLFRRRLLAPLSAPDGTPWLALPLAPHPKIAECLAFPQAPLPGPPRLHVPPETEREIAQAKSLRLGPLVFLDCSDEELRRRCAAAIAGERGVVGDPLEALATGSALLTDTLPDDTSGLSLVLIHGAEPAVPHRRLVVPPLSPELQAQAWAEALAQHGLRHDPTEVTGRFALSLSSIEAAATWLSARGGGDLFQAAAAQTVGPIAELAQQVKGSQSWDDLVVPEATAGRLRAVASAIERRRQVFEGWGFAKRVGGTGLKALFSGPSGTGKTMAVGIVGRALGLHVFRVDLASTVSKYIGETEKNLARIFDAAASSGAILFFDEADALFGKRSEVKDAHDRYANLEVAYLLQRMEDYDGAVILATNLSRNLDEAFSRRMHYVVEFPIPDLALRRRLWRGIFPASAPLDADVDLDFLAERFEMTGGRIQTIALDAAFMAAQEESRIAMRHLVRAVAGQLRKEGRIPSLTDFGAHYETALSPGATSADSRGARQTGS